VASQPSFAPAPNLGSVPPNPSFPGGVASVPIFAFVLPLRRTLDDEDQGAGLTVGYEVLPWLAFEFGWRRLGNFRDALNSVSSFSVGVEEYAATARVRWPITERLAAVARIGATRARFDVDGSLEFTTRIATITQPLRSPNDRAGYLIGAGTEWRFTKRFAAEVMYTRHDARVIEIDAVSAGVIFRI
ncbi:MAG: outer membrane beta-barrel protein, partial [Tepidisphaera sp.]|nr:outer membrane beta-barrel protein [Tepidisphaera sp.]